MEVLKTDDLSVPVGGVVTTLDGNRVSLVCEVRGVPDPQVTWGKDDAEVQRGGKIYTIETAARSDSGNYSCLASNIAGKAKATTQLNVLGKNSYLNYVRLLFFFQNPTDRYGCAQRI